MVFLNFHGAGIQDSRVATEKRTKPSLPKQSAFQISHQTGSVLNSGFKKVGENLFYLSDRGEVHSVSNCTPCGDEKTLCERQHWNQKVIETTAMNLSEFFSIPQGLPFECGMAPKHFPEAMNGFAHLAPGYTGFVMWRKDGKLGPKTFYVDGGRKYHAPFCRPCGPSFTICPDKSVPPSARVKPLVVPKTDLDKLENGGRFKCHLAPQYFKGYLLWHRRPLKLELHSSEPVRLNVITGIGKDISNLTGGLQSIIRFADQILRQTSLGVRWINVDGIGGEQLMEQLKQDVTFDVRSRMEVVFDGAREFEQPTLLTNPKDMFMSTVYFTAHIAQSTIQMYPGLHNRNQIYFIEDFDAIFFPNDAHHLEALESYKCPHFAIYSTPFLEKWFVRKKYGQGEFIHSAHTRQMLSYAIEPAIKPWTLFNKAAFAEPNRTRRIVVHARRQSLRNAYELTVDTLSAAVCEGFFDQERWEIIGVGGSQDSTEHLGRHCGRHIRMTVRENISENEYQKIVLSSDVGVSLMVSPHPSLPPFDFAAAGLVTLTNSFATKTQAMFAKVSSNFVVAEPTLPELLEGLATAIEKSKDIDARAAGAKLSWESEWDGDACYGPTLMKLVLSWFEQTESLW